MKQKLKSITNLITKFAPLALFAALGLALAAPQTAQAGNYYKFTFLRVKANPTGSGVTDAMKGKQLAISELALYDASMNRINLNLTKYTSSTPVGIGVNQFNISHAGMEKIEGALFNNGWENTQEKWFVQQDIASVKPCVVMRLADNAAPAAFYNLASADSVSGYDNRLPAEWKLEYSTDCSSWQELDHRNLDDSQLPTGDRTWYAGAGQQVANTAPKTCFLIQSQYTQVEYINAESRGPALRIFGFHLQADDYIQTKVMFNDVPDSGGGANNHAIFCNRQGSNSSSSFCSFVINGKLRFDYGPAGSDAQCSTDTLSKDVEYVIRGDGVSDQKLTATTGSTTAATANRTGSSIPTTLTSDLLLFAHSAYKGSGAGLGWDAPQTGDTDSLARMKMYYFKVYEAKGSSSLRLNLIPVKVGSQVGMYDQVSGVFYKSVTGTEFTAGTELSSFLGRLVLDPRNVAADADPNASGGDIVLKEGNDYIHIFTTPGASTFTVKPNVSATATALLVGGGGGGGNNCGGGGGGGGVTAVSTPTQLTSGDYSVTVGAGGAAALNSTVQGTAGGASSIGTLVSAPGGNGGYGFNRTDGNKFKGGTAGTGGGNGGDSHGSSQIGSNGSNGSSPYNILGFSQAQVFGGGGGGGAYGSGHGNSAGGAGGGGKGSGSKDNLYATAGENGLGGGGGGGAGGFPDNTAYVPGGAGGSGIVIIRVSSGSGPDPQKKSISAASVTYSATSVAYDGLAHQPTLTVKLENVDITSQCEITWDKSGFINAGTYTPTITAKSSSETYTGTVSNPGSFTINRKQITKPSAVQNLVYNGSQQTGVASGTGYTVTNGAKTNAGDYTASVSLLDKTNTEWADTHATADQNISWSIAKKSLTVTATINGKADNTTAIKEGSPAPTYGVQYSAFASGESASNLTTQPTATSNYTTTSPQGTYTVTPSGGVSGNYEFNYVSHTFQVTPAAGIKIPMPKPTQRTFKEVSGTTYTMTFEASDADGHFTVAGTQSASAPGVYQLCVTPKQNYCWEDDESVSPRTIEWGIVPSNYTEPFGDDRNFLKTLVNHPNRVSGGALPTGITGGDIILRFPNRENGVTVSHDYVHIFTNATASFNNETGVARPGRALIVGGGGGGGRRKYKGSYLTWGFDGVGGGGGGGGVRVLSDMIWDGEFSVTVGKGGASDSNGSPSSIVGGGASYEVLGGGHGGCGSNDSTADPDNNAVSGGSGGGGGLYANHARQDGEGLVSSAGSGGEGSLWGYSGSAGKAAQITTDSAGKVNKDSGFGGGGGGAGCGAGVTAPTSAGAMGAVSTVIDGRMLCFGGGGAGGLPGKNSATALSNGGFGGGGGNNQYHITLTYCQSGVDGLGGGGSGCVGQYNTTAGSGRPGGSGLVAIRYTDDTRLNQIKTVAVPRELLYDRSYNFNTHSTGLVDTDDYTVEGQLEGRDIGTYTVTLKLKYPDDSEWDDGTDQPQVLTWRIVPEGPISSDFYLKLCSNSNRVERDILQMGAPIVLRWKETDAVSGQEYNHYVNIFTDCVNNVQFELKEDLPNADVFLVGGGGGGGAGANSSYAGGGGGGGGYRLESTTLVSGTYSVAVGRGGLAGNAGGTSSVGGATGFSTLSVGGGGKGGSAQYAGGSADAQIGGSGGGAGGNSTAVGTAGPYGRNGGSGHSTGGGGGGGGAGAEGKSPAYASDTGNKGGDGLSNSILGYVEWFAGGGAGGEGPDSQGHVTYGGKGGGGNSVNRKKDAPVSTPGVNGQGGGGAGASDGNAGTPPNPTRGGDGIVIIAYTALSGSVVAKPQMNSMVCRYDGHEFDAREFLDSKLNLAFSGTCTATDVGTYTFEVTPAPGYHWLGTEEEDEEARDPVVFSWTIEPRVMADFVAFSAIGPQTYSGQDITPAVTLTDATWNGGTGRTLVLGTDYTLEYINNRNIGTATVKATGKGNYTGAMSTTFQIVNDPTVTGFYVTPEGGGDGTGWSSPCTLAEAVDKISSATQSKVAIYMKEGDYGSVGSLTVNASLKQVSVLGGYKGENMTIVSGGQSVLSGGSLTITAGQAVALGQLTFVGCAVSKSGSAALTVEHCAFRGISGYALTATAGSVTVASCSFSGNTSGSLSVSSGVAATVRNSILYSKTSGGEISNAGTLTLDHVLLSGAHSGGTQTGVITGNPLFASSTDLHLKSSGGRYVNGAWQNDSESSPAIDAGEGSYNGEYANDAGQNFGLNLGVYGNTQQASKSPVRTAATVTFDDAGGTGGPRQLSGWAGFPMPPSVSTPARAKFKFGGYFTGENGTGDKYYNADGSLVAGRTYPIGVTVTTLYANWEAATVTVTLNKNATDATNPNPTTVTATPGAAMPQLEQSQIPTRTGYTFTGYFTSATDGTKYYNDDGTSAANYPTADGPADLYAHWTANTYTVQFNGNGETGGSMSDQTYTYTESKALSANEFIRAYTVSFNSDDGSSCAAQTANYTVTGWATSASGTKVFDAGATVSGATLSTYATGGTVNLYAIWQSASITLPTPTKKGYTFTGWYNGSTKVTGTSYTPTANVTLTAHWTANTYHVLFEADGKNTDGRTPYRQDFVYDQTQKLTANRYVREVTVTYASEVTGATLGKTSETVAAQFNKWTYINGVVSVYDQGDFTVNNDNFSQIDSNGDIHFTAWWHDPSVTLPTASKAGYTFDGWYNAGGARVGGAGDSYSVTDKTVTLTARWTANTYTVKFDGNGSTGGATADQQFTYGTAQNLTQNGFVRAYTVTYKSALSSTKFDGAQKESVDKTVSYTFDKWNTAADGKGTSYADKQSVNNLTSVAGGTFQLYAQWTPGTYVFPTVTRSGYVFAGWFTEEKGGTQVTGGSPTADTTLWAHWTAVTWNNNYVLNGGTVSGSNPATGTYGSDFTVTAPTKTGYTFAGWKMSGLSSTAKAGPVDGTMVTINNNETVGGGAASYRFGALADEPGHTVTFDAQWTPIRYTITFKPNGGTISGSSDDHTVDVYYDGDLPNATAATPPDQATGVAFTGYYDIDDVKWYNADGTPVSGMSPYTLANNLTLYAHWNAKKYYKVGEDTASSSSFVKSANPESNIGWALYDGGHAIVHTVSPNCDYYMTANSGKLWTPPGTSEFAGDSLTVAKQFTIYPNASVSAKIIANGGNATATWTVSKPYESHCALSDSIEVPAKKDLGLYTYHKNDGVARDFVLTVDSVVTGSGNLRVLMGAESDMTKSQLKLAGDMSGFTGDIIAGSMGESEHPPTWGKYILTISGSFGGGIASLPHNDANSEGSRIAVNYDGLTGAGTKGLPINSTTIPLRVKDSITFFGSSGFDTPFFPLMTFPAGTTVDPATFTVYHAAKVDGEKTAFANLGKIVNSDGSVTLVANVHMIAKPTAVTGLIYNGSAQKGVLEGEGYTLTGNTGTDATSYTATATLKTGYVWEDGTTAAASVPWSIAKATNAWTTEPKLSATSYPANRPAVLTWGVATFGTATATLDGGSFAQGSALPVTLGNHKLVFTVAETSNYTGLSETIDFTVTDALYDLHAISATGPLVKDVPSSWLTAAFPTAGDYQAAFISTNVNGVTGWAAYILGFEGGAVPTAAIIEKTTQSKMSDDGNNNVMLTIALPDLPEEEDRPTVEGCTVAYSLLTSDNAETLRTGGGDVVDGCLKISSSSFTVPLSIPTDANHVYYRIRIHFIFGGGGEVVIFTQAAVTFGEDGWDWRTKKVEEEVKTDYAYCSKVIDVVPASLATDGGWLRLQFTADRGDVMGYAELDPLTSDGSIIHTGISSEKGSFTFNDGMFSGAGIAYDRAYYIPPSMGVAKLKLSYEASNLEPDVDLSETEIRNVSLTEISEADALAIADRNYEEVRPAFEQAKSLAPLSGDCVIEGVANLQKKLREKTGAKLLFLGDSIMWDATNGQLPALLHRELEDPAITMKTVWLNSTGPSGFISYVGSLPANAYDCIVFGGVSSARVDYNNTATYVGNLIASAREKGMEFVYINSLLSCDARKSDILHRDNFWFASALKVGFGQSCAVQTTDLDGYNWWYDGTMYMTALYDSCKPYKQGTIYSALKEACSEKATFIAPEPFLKMFEFGSGKTFGWHNRDSMHNNDYGKQANARLIVECLKMIRDYSAD